MGGFGFQVLMSSEPAAKQEKPAGVLIDRRSAMEIVRIGRRRGDFGFRVLRSSDLALKQDDLQVS